MERPQLDWDYFDIIRSLCQRSSRDRQVPSLCRERTDEGWDCFPRGFGEPGFRIDQAILERLGSMQPKPKPWYWFTPLLFVGIEFLRQPEVIYHATLFGLAAGLFVSPVVRLLQRQRLHIILHESRESVRELSSAERQSRNIRIWRQTTFFSHCIEIFALTAFVTSMAWLALLSFNDPSRLICASAWAPATLAAYATLTLLRYGELAIASMRTRVRAT
jgi:hypothetical protein